MAVRRILRMGHPNLRKVAAELPLQELQSDWFKTLIKDMQDTLTDYGGVGLAAPQIDEPWRVAIIEMGDKPSRYGNIQTIPRTLFVNPVIEVLAPAPTAGFWEGCLSVPGLRGYVERPQHLLVHYFDIDGRKQQLELEGFPATVIQHEFDHLDGKLYIDRIVDPKLLMFEEQLERHAAFWQEYPTVSE